MPATRRGDLDTEAPKTPLARNAVRRPAQGRALAPPPRSARVGRGAPTRGSSHGRRFELPPLRYPRPGPGPQAQPNAFTPPSRARHGEGGGGGPGHGWCQGPPRGTANPRGPGPGAGALPSNAPSGLPSKNRPGPAGLCPFNSRRDAAGAAPRRRPVSRAGVPPPTACK